MTSNMDMPKNPGSFNEFRDRTQLDGVAAVEGYSLTLHEFRQQLAKRAGISLEDLHEMRHDDHLVEMGDK